MPGDVFRCGLQAAGLGKNDRKWLPIWMEKYMGFHGFPASGDVEITAGRAVAFLKDLRSRTVPAWQRLQAVRALQQYSRLVLHTTCPPLNDIRRTLAGLAAREKHGAFRTQTPDQSHGISPTEPEPVQMLRRCLRTQHYAVRTETAYVGWVSRFLQATGATTMADLHQIDEAALRNFLSDLAIVRHVSASTQNQATSALLFLFQNVLGRDVGFIDSVRARTPERLPVVLSEAEVRHLLAHLGGRDLLIAQLLYGAGMRLMECLRLRVKDVCFDQHQLFIRDGKGAKDRVTVLPGSACQALKIQIGLARQLHEQDLADGGGEVWLPDALAVKWPQAAKELAWHYVFPATRLSTDPRTGVIRRHHISESVFPASLKRAVRRAGLEKRVTAHTLRHSFATHLMQRGSDIRTVQQLLGHRDVSTTMIYTHVLNTPGLSVTSPLDVIDGHADTAAAHLSASADRSAKSA